jgi:ribosomal protein S12 methylthiotransferase RimO
MSKKLHVVSLGCTKNLVDTEVMLGRLKSYDITDNPAEADVLIVNTCGFIDAAKEESINTILDLDSMRKKDSLLVMAGCLSERYQKELAAELPEIDIFTGVGDYANIDALLEKRDSRFTRDVFLIDTEERVITGSTYHAYIKLSEGCNQQCSFCAIPGFKGKLHSRTLASVEKEIKALLKKGYFDFSFISQDSSSYLRDQNIDDGLSLLVKHVEKIEGIKSARILYLYPSTTSKHYIDVIADSPVFHNYFDIPLQHISDAMLKRMKRGFGKEKTLDLMAKIFAVPNAYVRTAFIVGHPGETEEEFAELKAYIEATPFDMVTLFAYSDEGGTPAAEMADKLPDSVKEARLTELQTIVDEKLKARLNARVGEKVDLVLNGVSSEHDLLYSAKHLAWAPEIDPEILVNDSDIPDMKAGRIYHAHITAATPTQLVAAIIQSENSI